MEWLSCMVDQINQVKISCFFIRVTLHMKENIKIYRRYIIDISCIEGYENNIWWKNIVLTKFWGKSPNTNNISWYIGDISCIEGYENNIWWKNIVLTKFRGKSPNTNDISWYIGNMAINRQFFPSHLTTRANLPLVNSKLSYKENIRRIF